MKRWRRQSRGRTGAERHRCRRGRPHRLVADGPGAGARDLRLDVAAFVARAGRRLDRLAHARRISARRRSASGRLWTANARTIDTETWLAFLGDGGYDLGARAAQIRDDLLALQTASAADMTAIQLDDRALFLTRWRDLLLDLLNDARSRHPLRAQARELIEHWSGRAAVDDAGYRIVRAARSQVRKDVFESLTALARQRFPATKFAPSAQFEGPLWQLVTQRPAHLLDPHYDSWEAALLGSLDRALAILRKSARSCNAARGARATCCT